MDDVTGISVTLYVMYRMYVFTHERDVLQCNVRFMETMSCHDLFAIATAVSSLCENHHHDNGP